MPYMAISTHPHLMTVHWYQHHFIAHHESMTRVYSIGQQRPGYLLVYCIL